MFFFFFFNDTATTEIYTLSLHDALPISGGRRPGGGGPGLGPGHDARIRPGSPAAAGHPPVGLPGRPARDGRATCRRLPRPHEHGRRWPAPLAPGRPRAPAQRLLPLPLCPFPFAHAYAGALASPAHAIAPPAVPLAFPAR